MTEWTIYNNRIPTYLLNEDELVALQAHDGKFVYWLQADQKFDLINCRPLWCDHFIYRAVRKPVREETGLYTELRIDGVNYDLYITIPTLDGAPVSGPATVEVVEE